MKGRISSILKFLFFIGIGIFLIWMVVKDITPETKAKIFKAFEDANYFWVFVSIIVSIFSHYIRAIRWKMLLKPLGYSPKTNNTFFAVMIGYLANLALPRLGEVTRCGILTKYEKVPFNQSFGTVIAERAVDMICVTLVFFLMLFMEMDVIYSFVDENIFTPLKTKLSGIINNPSSLLISIIVIGLLIAGGFFLVKKVKGALMEKIRNLLLGVWEGLKTINKVESPFWFYFHSLFIWFLYYASLHLSFLAIEEVADLGVGSALAVLVFGSIGIMFIPGGTGAYQALVKATLMVYGISEHLAIAFSWVGWGSQIISVLLVGLLSLLLIPVVNKNNEEARNT